MKSMTKRLANEQAPYNPEDMSFCGYEYGLRLKVGSTAIELGFGRHNTRKEDAFKSTPRSFERTMALAKRTIEGKDRRRGRRL
jgi:hypothetical protein